MKEDETEKRNELCFGENWYERWEETQTNENEALSVILIIYSLNSIYAVKFLGHFWKKFIEYFSKEITHKMTQISENPLFAHYVSKYDSLCYTGDRWI